MGTQPGTGHCPELEDDLPEAQWYQQGVRLSALEHQNLNQCVCVCVCACVYCLLPPILSILQGISQLQKPSLN